MQVCRYASTAGIRAGLRHPWGHSCTCTGNWLPEFAGIFRQNSGGFWLQEPGAASLGPSEPTPYEFNQMMNPLIDELIELERGLEMSVFSVQTNRRQQEYVHAHLSLARLDHMARIQVCGHAVSLSSNISEMTHDVLDLPLRDPRQVLYDKSAWLNAPPEQQEQMRKRTGVIFTEFDRLPGWYSLTMCPPDPMHLIHLGTTKFILRDILLLPGMMTPRAHQAADDSPLFEKLTSGKAEQYRHLEVVLYAVLFVAWKEDDDLIPDGLHTRGSRNSKSYKFQQKQAKNLLDMRRKVHHYDRQPRNTQPTLVSCGSVQSRQLIYRTILRYCLAVKIVHSRQVSCADLAYARRLFSRVAVDFARLNIPLTPNWHYLQHLVDSMLKFGSADQFWTFYYEQFNRKLLRVNKNGHTMGVLETTMARGFLKRAAAHRLVHDLQSIGDPRPDDISTISYVLGVMRNGPEHKLQHGMLNAVLAGEAHFCGQERIALATTSAQVNWMDNDHRPFWDMVIDFCNTQINEAVVYSYGAPPNGGVRLEPRGSTRCFPYVHHGGIRFGNDFQTQGKSSRYGYIKDLTPVLIRRIYQCTFQLEDQDEPHRILCAVIQRFTPALEQAVLPWDEYVDRLEVQSWAYDELEPPKVVGVNVFTGVFALGDIELNFGRYWLTFAMKPVEPEAFEG
ncbi:Transposase family Tnp2 protein [Ceratobasidium sp. AG-Ba]|nr:Transposase family Tnp2 protein [Ceratobasidium sp. AG-Ba]